MAVRAHGLSQSVGACLLGLAVPLVFLHADYQPAASVGLGGTSVELRLSDLAVVLAAVAALAALARDRAGGLRAGLVASRWVWLLVLALLGWVLLGTLLRAGTEGYAFSAGLVNALKFSEYALLAVAIPVLVRTARDVAIVTWALAGWTTLAALVALAQLFGADILDAWTPGRRQPSFVGHHDLAALSALGLSLAVATIVVAGHGHPARRLTLVAGTAGFVAMVVSGTVVGAFGFAIGCVAALAVASRGIGVSRSSATRVGALAVAVVAGVLVFRGGDVLDFFRFVGLGPDEERLEDVQTYSHRSVLAYIGVRIWLDHPGLGVGWQASGTERGYRPYLADARRRFPNVAEEAFPAPGREWGVQNAYVQAGADLGTPGFLLFTATVLAPLGLVWRRLRRAAPRDLLPLTVVVLAFSVAGLWLAQGLVAGIPLAAVMWIAVGVAACGRGTSG